MLFYYFFANFEMKPHYNMPIGFDFFSLEPIRPLWHFRKFWWPVLQDATNNTVENSQLSKQKTKRLLNRKRFDIFSGYIQIIFSFGIKSSGSIRAPRMNIRTVNTKWIKMNLVISNSLALISSWIWVTKQLSFSFKKSNLFHSAVVDWNTYNSITPLGL